MVAFSHHHPTQFADSRIEVLELTRNVADRARNIVGIAIQNLAIQDVIALAFHAYIFLRVSLAPDSPDAIVARRLSLALFMVTACALTLSRGEVIASQRARAITYRVGLFLPMVLSYFGMRPVLAAMQPTLLDHRLYAIDLWLFGTTPSVWLEFLNVRPIVEWVSFFYTCYFALLVAMLIPALFFDKGRRLQELMAGALFIAAFGHFLYTVVPGAGPFATLQFDEPLQGGFWWNHLFAAVSTAGAQLDIFPSLHTAYPTFFTIHAFAYRRTQPFKWAWPVIAFFAANIVVATMLLRWHWAIDVVVGVLFAFAARRFAVAVAEREELRGGPYDDRQPVWESIADRP